MVPFRRVFGRNMIQLFADPDIPAAKDEKDRCLAVVQVEVLETAGPALPVYVSLRVALSRIDLVLVHPIRTHGHFLGRAYNFDSTS